MDRKTNLHLGSGNGVTQSDEYSYTTRTTPSCPVTARLAINTRSWLSYGPGRHLLLFHKILQRSHHQTRKPDHRHIRHSRRTIPSRRARYRTADALCVFPVISAVPPVVVAVVVVARGLLVPVAATAAQAFVAVTGVYVSLLEERAATQISLEAFWTSVHEH